MAKTRKPAGLSIARENTKFTFSWKVIDSDYNGGFICEYRTNLTKKWTSLSRIGDSATSITFNLPKTNYYPYTDKHLRKLYMRCRAKRATSNGVTYDWSDWSEYYISFLQLGRPSISQTLDESNVTTFNFEQIVSETDRRIYTRTQYQSILVRASNVTDGAKLKWTSTADGWRTGTFTSTTGSVRVTEDSSLLVRDSYTRWIRFRAQGPIGCSEWRYAKHVYARPYNPFIKTAKVTIANGVSNVLTTWGAAANAAHPIDQAAIQWAIDTPVADQACPAGATFETALTLADTTGEDAAQFPIDDVPGIDECLWLRVMVKHDANIKYSDVLKAYTGKLAAPSGLVVTSNPDTYMVTVTANNNSDVPDADLAVVYRSTSEEESNFVVARIPHGSSSVTFQAPNWSAQSGVSFGVYAFQGDWNVKQRPDGVEVYTILANMLSDIIWDGGSVPVEPSGVSAVISEDISGEVIITWDWAWSEANMACLSWSQNPNAWESTDEPEEYEVTRISAARWRISGLETGVTWYFRVRLAVTSDDGTTYGPYCAPIAVDLSSAPDIPSLAVSSAIITEGASFTASWVYVSTDNTAQAAAEICEATVDNSSLTDPETQPTAVTYGDIIGHTTTGQNLTLTPAWQNGTTHYICVRVTSASGKVSAWSDPVPVTVAEPLTCTIAATSLTEVTLPDGSGDTRTVLSLTAMPFTATITGAGTGGTTTLIIERAAEYRMDRPDGETRIGNDGETIAIFTEMGEEAITIDTADLIGLLDDGAQYRIIATVQDGLGQSAEQTLDFEVHWTHQAEIPTATVTINGMVAQITATAPAGAVEGDVCDIYRLTADKPELIVQDGAFGTTYVDPYPAIGEGRGHRVVHRTLNGDYITADNQPAWVDLSDSEGDLLEEYSIIIDFDGNQLILPYNITLSSSWEKDFQLTRYLGGAQQGDWNAGVQRQGKIGLVLTSDQDADLIEGLRELAAFAGICHVRTPEGSSYPADIQVTEDASYESAGKLVSFSLSITKVDPEVLDGVPLAEWEA